MNGNKAEDHVLCTKCGAMTAYSESDGQAFEFCAGPFAILTLSHFEDSYGERVGEPSELVRKARYWDRVVRLAEQWIADFRRDGTL